MSCRRILDKPGSYRSLLEAPRRRSSTREIQTAPMVRVQSGSWYLQFTSSGALRGDKSNCCGLIWHLKPRNPIQKSIRVEIRKCQRLSPTPFFFWFSRFSGKLKRLEAGAISGSLCSSIRSSAFEDTGLGQPPVEISLRSRSASTERRRDSSKVQ